MTDELKIIIEILLAALAAILSLGVGYIGLQMKELASSVGELNVKIGGILIHLETHKEKLDDHNLRIRKLEEHQ
jgi:hypothetical protein